MNGIHDMGGMHGMGPIMPGKNEPVFHEAWEGRAFALSMAVGGDWPYGADRYQTEMIPPEEYLRQSYYERWLSLIQRDSESFAARLGKETAHERRA